MSQRRWHPPLNTVLPHNVAPYETKLVGTFCFMQLVIEGFLLLIYMILNGVEKMP